MLRNMESISSEAALQRLLQGNRRFTEERVHEVRLGARLREVAPAQYPFAAVFGCSDSRVPAEVVFDCSLGDLFVVRTAGHVLGPSVVGSLEYAAVHLHVPLILVLGHTRCGAIQAALNAAPGSTAPGSIAALVEGVWPAIERARTLPGDTLDHAVTANIAGTVAALGCAEMLAPMVEAGKLKVVGARYDLDTGEVQVLT
jgi:carbonic anhydrase